MGFEALNPGVLGKYSRPVVQFSAEFLYFGFHKAPQPMENDAKNPQATADLALAILDKLTGLNAEFSFDFDNMAVQLPGKPNAPENQIKVNGTLRIKTSSHKKTV